MDRVGTNKMRSEGTTDSCRRDRRSHSCSLKIGRHGLAHSARAVQLLNGLIQIRRENSVPIVQPRNETRNPRPLEVAAASMRSRDVIVNQTAAVVFDDVEHVQLGTRW